MDSLRAMEAFVLSVELGSLSGAARALGTTQPTVSKLVAALERSLGARLLRRGTAHLSLTDEGQRFHGRAMRLLEDYRDAAAEVREQSQQASGRLRVSAPVALGERWLNALMLEFLRLHPSIEIELLLDDRFADPVEERIDVSLRLGASLPPDLVARSLGRWPRVLVASPAYLAARGEPRRPQELAAHDYLRYAAGDNGDVLLQGPSGAVAVPVRSRYQVSNALALLDAVLSGAGISLQPTWMVDDLLRCGRLRRVLPRHTGPAQHAHLLYAARRQLPLRVRVLIDFLAERLAGLPGRVAD
ncbi:LysR family transcriptional regulator [uncultured Ramlibacter sp.]|uniref:LysR family transcriptional regulator n=1 Tax=uncultured Ramlibacter sp. TaxID=260755 RepID=UPI0026018387|nr:LysR family transcriptional regulator [uncultured Ramlibacter sp.]